MKIVASSDWRDAIPFDTLVVVADLVPGDPTRCFSCGTESEPRDRTELWAYKHRHPKNHDGFVRFYCAEHRPVIEERPVAMAAPGVTARAPRAPKAPKAPKPERQAKPVVPERIRAMCPNCFVEVSATGECGMCGWSEN